MPILHAIRSSAMPVWAMLLSAIVGIQFASPTWAEEDVVYRIASPAGTPTARGLRAEKAALKSKASHALAGSFARYREHVAQEKARGKRGPFRARDGLVQISGNRVLIDARAVDDGARLLKNLQSLGLKNGSRSGNIVSGLLPLNAINRAVELGSLRSIAASPPPILNAGSITSQGDIALRADVARTVHAVDGTGVTVGVLSDSYDTLGGAAADIASGDLPPGGVTVLNGESTLCGSLIFCIDEGRAMLQIVHDMAPGANLLFHTALDGKAAFASGIAALTAAGADILVDDLFFLNEPMFQDGVIAQAVDAAVASGSVYFSAAGNQGRDSYESAFNNSGEVFCIELLPPAGDCHPIYERVGIMHDFDPGPGVDTVQGVTVPVNGVLTIAMQWDAPFGGPGPGNDHDIMVLDPTGAVIYEISANDNVVMGEGWEAVQFQNADVLNLGTSFGIAITYDDVDSTGPPATLIKTVIFSNGASVNEYTTSSSTLVGHANAVGATAVGAAFFLQTPEFGVAPAQLEPFSSAGGSAVLFDASGALLTTPQVRQKPDITATDGVNTTFFFNDSYGNDGIDDFFGTSAAAPHAAGVAALLLEASPLSMPADIHAALEFTALDMGIGGYDFESGHGLIQTDLAIDALTLDSDSDGVADFADNCVTEPNGPLAPAACDAGIAQRNTDGDALGDACDADDDDDGLPDTAEDIDINCMVDAGETDSRNADTDGDGVDDGQDQYPLDPLLTGLMGDINGDGEIDIRDLLLMERALLGHVTLDLAQTYRADLHPGGGADDIDLADLIALQKQLMASEL